MAPTFEDPYANVPLETLRNDEYWRDKLTPAQYQVCRQKGTERPFSGEYCEAHDPGTYACACCQIPLFKSEKKFDSGTGWPSFNEPIAPGRVEEHADRSLFMVRTEILCARCRCHLGHVFDDGPPPTGLRYCVNSLSLKKI